jgi:hypothetical protein
VVAKLIEGINKSHTDMDRRDQVGNKIREKWGRILEKIEQKNKYKIRRTEKKKIRESLYWNYL